MYSNNINNSFLKSIHPFIDLSEMIDYINY